MAIARYENVVINTVSNSTDDLGQYTTTITPWFTSRAIVKDVRNNLRISERYRVYQDLVNLTFNYTPNMKSIVDAQDEYSFTWRNQEWRITDVFESDDRMSITFVCYFNAPDTPV
jgi:hypothetical protein